MSSMRTLTVVIMAGALTLAAGPALWAAPERIALPAPRLQTGLPLMQALARRASSRAFASKPLARQHLAGLLWAAAGINRPASGKRTAPSAHDRREITVYAVLADGLYRYDAAQHALVLVKAGDLRALTGRQRFAARAPLNLVYVLDFNRTPGVPRPAALEAGAIAAGAMVQNAYLYCASAGLATVVRGWIDKPKLAKAMGLGPRERILVAQTVGYPAGSN